MLTSLNDKFGNVVNNFRMDALEIWRIAGDLIAKYGPEGAVFHAAGQADRCRTGGDSSLAQDWLLVLDAVEEIVRPVNTCDYAN